MITGNSEHNPLLDFGKLGTIPRSPSSFLWDPQPITQVSEICKHLTPTGIQQRMRRLIRFENLCFISVVQFLFCKVRIVDHSCFTKLGGGGGGGGAEV